MPTPFELTPLNVRLRSDIQWSRVSENGAIRLVATDPLKRDHFSCHERDHQLLTWLSEETTLLSLCQRFQHTYRPSMLAPDELYRFLHQSQSAGILSGTLPDLSKSSSKKDARRPSLFRAFTIVASIIVKMVQFQVSFGSPQRLLDCFGFLLRFLFHQSFMLTALIGMLVALILVLFRFTEFAASLPDWSILKSPSQLLGFGAIFLVTRALHEAGHALACQRFGIGCRDAGIIVSFGMVCPYVDITEGWKAKQASHRMIIALGGIYVEGIVAAAAACFWCFSSPGIFHDVCYQTVLVCSISTLAFNANPLMKYDGYFALSDLLGINNLRERSWLAFDRLAGGEREESLFRQFGLSLYFLLSLMNRGVLSVGLIWFVFGLALQWQLAGFALGLILLYGCCLLALSFASWISRPSRSRGNLPTRSILVGWGGVAIVIIWSMTYPLPRRTWSLGQVAPAGSHAVYVSESGVIEPNTVTHGAWINQGDPIVHLRNDVLQRELLLSESSLRQSQIKIDSARNATFYDSKILDTLPVLESHHRVLEAKHLESWNRVRALQVTAPKSGRFQFTSSDANKESQRNVLVTVADRGLRDTLQAGCILSKGTCIGNIQIQDAYLVECQVSLDETNQAYPGMRATIRLAMFPNRLFDGIVRSVSTSSLPKDSNGPKPSIAASSQQTGCSVQVECPEWKQFKMMMGSAEVMFHHPDESALTQLAKIALKNLRWR